MPTGVSRDITISLANATFSKVREFLGRLEGSAEPRLACGEVARPAEGMLIPSWFLPRSGWWGCSRFALAAGITMFTEDVGGNQPPWQRVSGTAKLKGDAVSVQAFSRDLLQSVTGFLHLVKKGGLHTFSTVTRTRCLGEITFLVPLWVFAPPQSLLVSRCPDAKGQPGPRTLHLGVKDRAPSPGQRALCWLRHCVEYSAEIRFHLTSAPHCRALFFFSVKILFCEIFKHANCSRAKNGTGHQMVPLEMCCTPGGTGGI